jgi:hypothetical protein
VPRDVVDVPRWVASYRLAPPAPVPPIVLDRSGWKAAAASLSRGRLTGLAVLAVADGALAFDEEHDLDDLGARDRVVQRQALRAERVTLELCDELAGAGIDHAVLKGPTVGHADVYPGPSARPFTDADLLVRSRDLAAVVARCERRGARRLVPQLRPGFDRRFAKSVTLLDPSGIEIDLHRTLSVGPLTHLIPEPDLWDGLTGVEVLPSHTIPALSPDLLFLHACVHAATGGTPRWLSYRDIVVTSSRADLQRCSALAVSWQATAVVRDAILAAGERGLPVPDDLRTWATTLPTTARAEQVAAVYARTPRTARGLAMGSWRFVPGSAAKLAYAWGLVLPSRANRAARGRSVAGQLRRMLGRPA